jgi:hypothetical protein
MADDAAVAEKKKTDIAVLYNGRIDRFAHKADETVGTLLAKAIERFGVVSEPHRLSLFDATGRELPDAETLHQAKVKAGAELVLRQSTVKGG